MTIEDIRASQEYKRYCSDLLPDPYPLFHILRREDPVHWCEPLNGWILTRYDEKWAAGGHYATLRRIYRTTIFRQI